MKTSSKKAKGRNLQNFISNELKDILWYNPLMDIHERLEADDIKPAIMGESGVDIKYSPKAKRLIKWDIECKNQENWSIPSWWNQTISNTEKGRKPLLVIKKNRQEPLVVLRWSDFKEML